MKKLSKPAKLSLSSETIRKLDDQQMRAVAGAWTNTCLGTACTCQDTYGPDCPTVGFTNCLCTFAFTCASCERGC